MCELTGADPYEDMPMELDDFPWIVQQAYILLHHCPDNYVGMQGIAVGKVLNNLSDIMDIKGITDKELCLEFIMIINQTIANYNIKQANAEQKRREAQSSKPTKPKIMESGS